MTGGRLVVFEGVDGSGKTTQARLLFNYLNARKIPTCLISFPRYLTPWGKMIKRYLAGEFGRLGEVDPYLASVLYAGDRFAVSGDLKHWLTSGKIVVCDRYIGSNAAHMGAKIGDRLKRAAYIRWLYDIEYRENGIPRESLVIMLDVPVVTSRKLISHRKLDIHEKDLGYLEKVQEVYREIADSHKKWVSLDCIDNEKLMPSRIVHEKVREIIKKWKII